MKLALYVHDLRLEVGHSNSLIELIRHLPQEKKDQITKIEVINFTCMDTKDLFPGMAHKVRRVKVPFNGLKPFMMKSIFYQVWTFIYNHFFQEKDFYKIGIGICCLDVDAVSIQFIHKQWTEKGLEIEKGFWLRYFYKKLLFLYYEVCEKYLFSKKNIKLFSPANFLTQHLQQNYSKADAVTIYSGINLNRFKLDASSKEAIFEDLLKQYPTLQGLDLKKPVYIFVGAYERKGIHEAIEIIKKVPGAQFIVVGSQSFGKKIVWPSEVKVFTVSFTKRIQDFYTIADIFVFPTLYEPFGLVIFEAMAMGLTIVTRKNEVGASELIQGLPEVFFVDEGSFDLSKVWAKSLEERKALREQRLSLLGNVSWDQAGHKLSDFLSK